MPRVGAGGQGGESHHTAVPGNVVGGFRLVELHDADGGQGQQPGQGHVAPQDSEEGPQQAAQITEYFFPDPGVGAMGIDVWKEPSPATRAWSSWEGGSARPLVHSPVLNS